VSDNVYVALMVLLQIGLLSFDFVSRRDKGEHRPFDVGGREKSGLYKRILGRPPEGEAGQ